MSLLSAFQLRNFVNESLVLLLSSLLKVPFICTRHFVSLPLEFKHKFISKVLKNVILIQRNAKVVNQESSLYQNGFHERPIYKSIRTSIDDTLIS